MHENKIKESLKIKPVSLKYLDQYNELLRYVFQVTDRELEESGYEDGELRRSKRPILQEADVFGWFTHDDELVSQICIYPCEVNIHSRIFRMGGVTGVGTYPEFAGMGLMNDLIRLALQKMRKAEQYVSYLYPYSIPYYRRKGWEIMSDHITFTLKDTEIPETVEVPGHVERLPVGDEDVKGTYDRFARCTHGALISCLQSLHPSRCALSTSPANAAITLLSMSSSTLSTKRSFAFLAANSISRWMGFPSNCPCLACGL